MYEMYVPPPVPGAYTVPEPYYTPVPVHDSTNHEFD